MPGRAMTGYVCVAATWRAKPAPARAAIGQALEWTRQMPGKKPAARKAAKGKATRKKDSRPEGLSPARIS